MWYKKILLKMPRKDWFYVPLPLVMATVLDEIVEREGKKYGIVDRTELIRIIIGEFLLKYDKDNVEVKNVLLDITKRILNHDQQD